MSNAYLISAIGTPLDREERLHEEGLRGHLDDQWSHGIDGVLVAGTMGLLQLLREQTYRRLVELSVELCKGRGELLMGAGDAGFARTRDRIEFLNQYPIDGVVVLTPYFLQFSQQELGDYFLALADVSRPPLYLYNLPARTHVELEHETVQRVAEHPNVRGIKCSCDLDWTRELIRRVGDHFRIVVAAPTQVDALLREGMDNHLDGMYALAPLWVAAIGRAADAGDWPLAAEYQQRLTALLDLLKRFGGFPVFSALLNARGIPGDFRPAPIRPLSDQQRQTMFDDPVARQLLAGN